MADVCEHLFLRGDLGILYVDLSPTDSDVEEDSNMEPHAPSDFMPEDNPYSSAENFLREAQAAADVDMPATSRHEADSLPLARSRWAAGIISVDNRQCGFASPIKLTMAALNTNQEEQRNQNDRSDKCTQSSQSAKCVQNLDNIRNIDVLAECSEFPISVRKPAVSDVDLSPTETCSEDESYASMAVPRIPAPDADAFSSAIINSNKLG
jgi:hypothetical protein